MAEHQLLACEWHGGQTSALYAYCSTGTIISGLTDEIERVITWCENNPDTDEAEDLESLQAFLQHVEEVEAEFPRCPTCEEPIDYCTGHGDLG